MQVVTLEVATKEAEKLKATDEYHASLVALRERAWSHLIGTRVVRQLKWRGINDVYEVRLTNYRTAFLIHLGTTAFVFGFFKKQSDKLKDSELKLIKTRAAEIRRNV